MMCYRVLLVMGIGWLAGGLAMGQGCVIARNCAPLFGAHGPYLDPGDTLFTVAYRYQHADEFFVGHDRVYMMDARRNQTLVDLSAKYAINARTSFNVSVPFVDLTFSPGLPPPTSNLYEMHGHGLGDLTIGFKWWLRHPDNAERSNVQWGLGVKFPTGDPDVSATYPDINGLNPTEKSVDISSQPGDGGVGVVLDLAAFQKMGTFMLFLDGSYLANPRNTNNTVSLPANFNGFNNVPPNIRYNSVPDQYLLRAGVGFNLSGGLSANVAWRLEGSPPRDLIGGSDGFRFAGWVQFIEPGLTYARGRDSFTLSVPIRFDQDAQDVPATPGPDMATLAKTVVLFSYSHRFGK